jgi:hypothetical protein
VLISWTAYLAFSLPSRQVSSHYNVAWVVFDVFLLVTLAPPASSRYAGPGTWL